MPVLVYSLLRILLIVIAGAGLYLAGMRGLLLVVVAVLVGAALSYLVLDNYRRASAQWLQSRGKGHTRMEDRLESDAEAEDALLDEQEQHERETGAQAIPGEDAAGSPGGAGAASSEGADGGSLGGAGAASSEGADGGSLGGAGAASSEGADGGSPREPGVQSAGGPARSDGQSD